MSYKDGIKNITSKAKALLKQANTWSIQNTVGLKKYRKSCWFEFWALSKKKN